MAFLWSCIAFYGFYYDIVVVWHFMAFYSLVWPFFGPIWPFMANYLLDWTCIVFFSRGHRSKLIWSCFAFFQLWPKSIHFPTNRNAFETAEVLEMCTYLFQQVKIWYLGNSIQFGFTFIHDTRTLEKYLSFLLQRIKFVWF